MTLNGSTSSHFRGPPTSEGNGLLFTQSYWRDNVEVSGMMELQGFASRHSYLSVQLEKLYQQLSGPHVNVGFTASVRQLNDDICELQRDVMDAVMRRFSSPAPETRFSPTGCPQLTHALDDHEDHEDLEEV